MFFMCDEWKRTRIQVFQIYGKKCSKCSREENLQVDHILPISLFPELRYEITNLQPLCEKCNKLKSNIDFTRFVDEIGEIEKPSIVNCKIFYRTKYNHEHIGKFKRDQKKKNQDDKSEFLWQKSNDLYKKINKGRKKVKKSNRQIKKSSRKPKLNTWQKILKNMD